MFAVKKKPAKKKPTKKATPLVKAARKLAKHSRLQQYTADLILPEPIRFAFVYDDDGHVYLIEASQEKQFEKWLDNGPYWEDYDGEDFNKYRVDGTGLFTFTDPRSDR